MAVGIIIFLTPLAVMIARRLSGRWPLPVLTAAVVYPPFLFLLQTSSLLSAFFLVLIWSLVLSLTVMILAYRRPEEMGASIWRAKEYTESMFVWIRTGKLPEGKPSAVVLFHLKQTALYCLFALISANLLSLILGAALLNYMNYYVAQLARNSKIGWRAWLLGWNPWSVVRVLAFLWLGVILGLPLLSYLEVTPFRFSSSLLLPGLAGAGADIVLKISLSSRWAAKLRNSGAETSN